MACILTRWRNKALDAEFANCPLDNPFITPETDAMFMMLGVKEEGQEASGDEELGGYVCLEY